jgi:hypothetical protein
LTEIPLVGQEPFDCTEHWHAVQLAGAEIVTPPATLVSTVGHVPGHPSDCVVPFWRTIGPCHPGGTDGTHVPVQPLLLAAVVLEEVVLEAPGLEELVLELDAPPPPIPELDAVLLWPPPPAGPPVEDDDERPAAPVLEPWDALAPPWPVG